MQVEAGIALVRQISLVLHDKAVVGIQRARCNFIGIQGGAERRDQFSQELRHQRLEANFVDDESKPVHCVGPTPWEFSGFKRVYFVDKKRAERRREQVKSENSR